MGPTWPFYLCIGLMMRDTGFLQVDGGQRDPRDLGRHRMSETFDLFEKFHAAGSTCCIKR